MIHVGDCVAIMPTMDAQSVALVVTSPPYDNLRRYASKVDLDGVIAGLRHVLMPGGVCVCVVADQTVKGSESGTSFRQALAFIAAGFRLHDTMIYRKTNPAPITSNRYQPAFEFMFVFSLGAPRVVNLLRVPSKYAGKVNRSRTHRRTGSALHTMSGTTYRDTRPRQNVWEYAFGRLPDAERKANPHPATFPLDLARDHVLSWSNPGDVVRDPFAGSGTTLRAAIECGREAVGIEIDPAYAGIARRRLGIAQEVAA